MPNYKYHCNLCGGSWTVDMPISSDPKEKIMCSFRTCVGSAERRIIGSSFKIERDTFGDWYKKETGRELLGE